MLIPFDPNKMKFERVKFKGATTALGGSIRVLDEPHLAKTGKERAHKLDAPMAVVRAFLIKYNYPKFLHPMEGAITYYNDRVVALEIAPKFMENKRETEGLWGKKEWTIQAQTNWDLIAQPGMAEGKWFFDGVYAYTFEHDLVTMIKEAHVLSQDGKFREIRCKALNLTRLAGASESGKKRRAKAAGVEDEPTSLGIEERSCMAFLANNEVHVVTPPIWKQLGAGLSSRGGEIASKEDGVFESSAALDALNDKVFINLSFALSAGKEIAEGFGYDQIAPLQLPKLMVQLKTVNLPRVVKEIKATHDIGLQFTHGLAWLLGLLHRARNEEQVAVCRRMLKYLTTKGIYLRSRLKATNIVHNEHLGTDIQLMSPAAALQGFNGMTKEQFEIIMKSAAMKGRTIDILSKEGE